MMVEVLPSQYFPRAANVPVVTQRCRRSRRTRREARQIPTGQKVQKTGGGSQAQYIGVHCGRLWDNTIALWKLGNTWTSPTTEFRASCGRARWLCRNQRSRRFRTQWPVRQDRGCASCVAKPRVRHPEGSEDHQGLSSAARGQGYQRPSGICERSLKSTLLHSDSLPSERSQQHVSPHMGYVTRPKHCGSHARSELCTQRAHQKNGRCHRRDILRGRRRFECRERLDEGSSSLVHDTSSSPGRETVKDPCTLALMASQSFVYRELSGRV